ncbi:hypothetical protein MBANPS3_011918 [Mucor bainieri]
MIVQPASANMNNAFHLDMLMHYSEVHADEFPGNTTGWRLVAPVGSPRPAPLPLAHDLTDQEVIEETKRCGWHWPNSEDEITRRIWLHFARHGDSRFVRRGDVRSAWVIQQYLTNNHIIEQDDIGRDYIDQDDIDQDFMEQDDNDPDIIIF